MDCTFTNLLRRGKITVVKNTVGGDGSFAFTSNTLGGFTLATAGSTASQLFNNLLPGTYDVAETVPGGWDLASATCSDGSNPASIGLSPGEEITCTFNDVKRGEIRVDKVTNPAGSMQSFAFALTGGPDSLNVPFSLTDGSPLFTSGAIKPGAYSVAETVPQGWTMDLSDCSDGSSAGSIALEPGETVTCTFRNSTGAILISKSAKKYSAGGSAPLAGATFVVKSGDTTVATVVTGANGQACVGGLVVGANYSVAEIAAPAGYAS